MKNKLYSFFLIAVLLSCLVLLVPGAEQSPTVILPERTRYTLMIFTAKWCAPCQSLHKAFENEQINALVIKQYSNDIHWIDIDAPENATFVQQYGVRSIPRTFIVKRVGPTTGVIQTSQTGYIPTNTLRAFLQNPEKYAKSSK